MRRRRLPSTVNRPRDAKSGLTKKAREIIERTKRAMAERVTATDRTTNREK